MPIIEATRLVVSDYHGVSLSAKGFANVDVNPSYPETQSLRAWMSRRKSGVSSTPNYSERTDGTFFTVKLYHGGRMVSEPTRHYRDGKCEYFDNVDVDCWGKIELKSYVEELGYDKENVVFWHKHGWTLERGASVLIEDMDIYNIVKKLPENREVEIYVEHQIEKPSFIQNDDTNVNVESQDISSLPQSSPVLDFSFLDDFQFDMNDANEFVDNANNEYDGDNDDNENGDDNEDNDDNEDDEDGIQFDKNEPTHVYNSAHDSDDESSDDESQNSEFLDSEYEMSDSEDDREFERAVDINGGT